MKEDFEKILKLLEIHGIYGGMEDKTDLVIISCSYEFEPHGRACEVWEMIYRLKIPYIPFYWLSTTGYRVSNDKSYPWVCSGKTLEDVFKKTLELLTTVKVEKRIKKEDNDVHANK